MSRSEFDKALIAVGAEKCEWLKTALEVRLEMKRRELEKASVDDVLAAQGAVAELRYLLSRVDWVRTGAKEENDAVRKSPF